MNDALGETNNFQVVSTVILQKKQKQKKQPKNSLSPLLWEFLGNFCRYEEA